MRVSDRQSQRGDGTPCHRGAKGGLGGWRQDGQSSSGLETNGPGLLPFQTQL